MTELTPSFNGTTPLYDQLYRYIVDQIRTGALRAGEKLPSKRRLCEHLGVSLTTVEKAYGLLTAEVENRSSRASSRRGAEGRAGGAEGSSDSGARTGATR